MALIQMASTEEAVAALVVSSNFCGYVAIDNSITSEGNA